MEPSDWIIVGMLAFLMVVGLFVQGFSTFLAEPEDEAVYIQQTMQQALDELSEKIVRRDDFMQTAFMQLDGDPTMQVTHAVSRHLRQLEDGRHYRGPDGDYVMDELEKDLGSRFLVRTLDEARQVARETGVEAVMYGKGRKVDNDDVAEVELELHLLKAKKGKLYPEEVYPPVHVHRTLRKSVFSLAYYRLRVADTSLLFRLILWFVILTGLPFVLYPLELKIFRLESNTASMGLLICLTVAGFALTLFLNGVAFSGIWITLYLALLAGMAAYNYAVLNALEEAT